MYRRPDHEVMPAESALSCVRCHDSLKGERTCDRCHQDSREVDFKTFARLCLRSMGCNPKSATGSIMIAGPRA